MILPAPDPAARRGTNLLFLLLKTLPKPLAKDLPISTLGPSGPKEHPVPSVIAAALALKNGAITYRSCLCKDVACLAANIHPCTH